MASPATSPGIHIAVIGAGIVGASVACHLARRGAHVRLFDEGPAPASGVTRQAFGWVNLINGTPSGNLTSYRLRQQAVEDYARLKREMPEALQDARPGSLVWKSTAEETVALAREHLIAGTAVELVDAMTVARAEPHLRNVPECAVSSPQDLAFDPVRLAERFLHAAAASGADIRFGERVLSVETSAGRVIGVRTPMRFSPADLVVIAAGSSLDRMTASLDIGIGVESAPAVLLRYGAPSRFLQGILRSPRLEIRQAADDSLLVAHGYIDDSGENGPAAIGRRMLGVMKADLVLPDGVELVEAAIGNRPVLADGLPRLGFLPGVEGAYVAVGHPGVILAPLLGRLAAEELIDGRRSALMPEVTALPPG